MNYTITYYCTYTIKQFLADFIFMEFEIFKVSYSLEKFILYYHCYKYFTYFLICYIVFKI